MEPDEVQDPELASQESAHTQSTIAIPGAPNNGFIWDKFGVAGPSNHCSPVANKQDWCVDIYAPNGTAVMYYDQNNKYYNTSSGNTSYQTAAYATCGTAGYTVDITIYDVYGNNLGKTRYGHLDANYYAVGATIPNGATLGKTKFHTQYQPGCWEVTNDGGTHVHYTMYNTHNYSCWVPRSAGSTMGYSYAMGRVGNHGLTSWPGPCW
jgi:hypothetical protein